MAASSSWWSLDGCWVTSAPAPNATRPTSMDDGCASTKRRATYWAAASRDGSTSSAVMLFETSTTNITVPAERELASVAWGRDRAKIMTASAVISSANG